MGIQLCLFPREELHAYQLHSKQRNTGSHSIFDLLHGLGSQRAWLIVGPFRLSVRHGLVVHIPQIPTRKHAFGNPTPAAWKQQYNLALIHPCLPCTTNHNLATHRVIATTCYIPSHDVGHRKHLAILGLLNENGHPSRDQLTVKLNALGTSDELSIRVMPF